MCKMRTLALKSSCNFKGVDKISRQLANNKVAVRHFILADKKCNDTFVLIYLFMF